MRLSGRREGSRAPEGLAQGWGGGGGSSVREMTFTALGEGVEIYSVRAEVS